MQQTERLRVDGRDMFSLAAELARRLREPPYHVRIADFGTDPRSGRAIARLIDRGIVATSDKETR